VHRYAACTHVEEIDQIVGFIPKDENFLHRLEAAAGVHERRSNAFFALAALQWEANVGMGPLALLRLLLAAFDPVEVVLALGLGLGDLDGFPRLVARVEMVLARLFFARLLLVWVLVVTHRNAPLNLGR
jgi:hypothetical protein